jgi:hypothetical protein
VSNGSGGLGLYHGIAHGGAGGAGSAAQAMTPRPGSVIVSSTAPIDFNRIAPYQNKPSLPEDVQALLDLVGATCELGFSNLDGEVQYDVRLTKQVGFGMRIPARAPFEAWQKVIGAMLDASNLTPAPEKPVEHIPRAPWLSSVTVYGGGAGGGGGSAGMGSGGGGGGAGGVSMAQWSQQQQAAALARHQQKLIDDASKKLAEQIDRSVLQQIGDWYDKLAGGGKDASSG